MIFKILILIQINLTEFELKKYFNNFKILILILIQFSRLFLNYLNFVEELWTRPVQLDILVQFDNDVPVITAFKSCFSLTQRKVQGNQQQRCHANYSEFEFHDDPTDEC